MSVMHCYESCFFSLLAISGSCDFRKSIEDQKLFFPEGLCCQPTEILTEEQVKIELSFWKML